MTFDLDTLSFPFLFLPAVLLCFTLFKTGSLSKQVFQAH